MTKVATTSYPVASQACCWPTRGIGAFRYSRGCLGLRSARTTAQQTRSPRIRAPVVTCQRRSYRRDGGNERPGGKDRRESKFEFNGTEFRIDSDNYWQLALPVGGFLLVSAFLGPLVIGLAASALAVGAVVSAGAVAFSTMFLPLFLMAGFGMLAFGFLPLTGMMAFGVLSIVTKLLSLGIALGGLAIGWGVVNWLLPKRKSVQSPQTAEVREIDIDDPRFELSKEERDMIEESRRRTSEFASFDDELRRREQRKRSGSSWQ